MTDAAVVVLVGQSLNVSRGTNILGSIAVTGYMLAGGMSIANYAFSSTNVEHVMHHNDQSSAIALAETTGQGPGLGIAYALMDSGPFAAVYMGSAAIGSRDIDVLISGGPKCNVYAMTHALVREAKAAGYTPKVMYHYANGEAAMAAGTVSENDYYTKGMLYCKMLQILAQQAMEDNTYVAPIVFTHPMEAKDGQHSRDIQQALARIAKDIPRGINAGGAYPYSNDSDRIHNDPAGMIGRGEMVGYCFKQFFASSIVVAPSKFDSVTLYTSGSKAEFVAVSAVDICRDSTLNVGTSLNASYQKDGVEWLDNGSYIAIDSLTYAGRLMMGTLHSVPTGSIGQQVFRVAMLETTSSTMAGNQYKSGSLIRIDETGWPGYYDPTYTHQRWMIPHYLIPGVG